jgi:DNA modification methylase
MRRPILNNSRPGQLIYDPFLGTGTSLIAAEMSGRICCGLEISPVYVDVILRRWQTFTGQTPVHQASGQSFDERTDSQDRDQSGSAHG